MCGYWGSSTWIHWDSEAGLDSLPWSSTLGLKQDPAELLLSAGPQYCSSHCLAEAICRMSATSSDNVFLSRGAPKGCQPLLMSCSAFLPPGHHTRKGSAAAERGQPSPAWIWGSTCSRRGKWHYPTVLSCLYGSVPTNTALWPDTTPRVSLLQEFKAPYTEITTAHLHLIVQGCSLWKEKIHWKLFMEESQPGNTCTEVLPGTAPALQNHVVKLDQKKGKWSVWGLMQHSSPSQGTNWDQEIRYWSEHFASSWSTGVVLL